MRILVTGGSGFLGQEVCRLLAARGDEVVALSRRGVTVDHPGVVAYAGDIRNRDDLRDAAQGAQAVIHTAALAGVWGRREAYESINIQGTENVLATCRAAGIAKLVFTSSPSVVFDGRDQEGLDETVGYPTRFLADYPRTKAAAEARVRAATDLATVSLRPHLIWGPGDPHLLPRVLRLARTRGLPLIGGGEQKVDTVYVTNAAQAHVQALDALEDRAAQVRGRVYFITNGDPRPLRWILMAMTEAAGITPRRVRTVDPRLAYGFGWLNEALLRMWPRGQECEPLMTRFMARQLGTAHWYSIAAARRDLGYKPEIGLDEGFAALRQYLSAGAPPNANGHQRGET